MKQYSLKKNILFNYIGQVYIIVIGVIVLPLYIKFLGSEAYGLVSFYTMLTSFLLILDMGMSSTLTREVAKSKKNKFQLKKFYFLFLSIEKVIIIVGFLIIFIMLLGADFIANRWLQIENLNKDIVIICIKIMGVIFIFRWLSSLYQGIVLGYEEQVWFNIFRIIMVSLKSIGGVLLIMFITNNIIIFFLYQLIISVVEILVLRLKIIKLLYINILYKIWFFSIKKLKYIKNFALSVAFTSIVWAFYSQFDKLILSHYLTLKFYGYLALIIALQGALMQVTSPISRAVVPRMVVLYSNNKIKDLKKLYKDITKILSILSFSIVSVLLLYGKEFVYAWTGDITIANWVYPILSFYLLGNAILIISSFRYYIQYVFGNLKYQNYFNMFFPFFTIPLIFLSAKFYGAFGTAVVWFFIHLITFLFWTPFIHKKFLPKFHKEWLMESIMPALISSLVLFIFFYNLNLYLYLFNYKRLYIILILFFIGTIFLITNFLSYPTNRIILKNKIKKFLKKDKSE